MEDRTLNFMKKAYEQAMTAQRNREMPVGCIFVRNDEIIASGYNNTNKERSVTEKIENRESNTLK